MTALWKMSGQEIPGLCRLTIFSMGGMMGSENMHLEKDFTLLLWLCISINDTLFIPQYTSTCIDILEERVKRFMSVTKIMIGPQWEMISQIGLRMAKFHGMKHYPHLIRKFGSPLNFFGGYLESFLKDKLKRPSKSANGQLHRLKPDILTRSNETRQFSFARKIVFASDSLHTENHKQTKMSKVHINVTEGISTEIDVEGMIPDTRMLPSTSTSPDNLGKSPTKIHLPSLPVKVQFSASSSNVQWTIIAGVPNKIGHVSRSKDAPLSQLVHPDLPKGANYGKSIANSAIEIARIKSL